MANVKAWAGGTLGGSDATGHESRPAGFARYVRTSLLVGTHLEGGLSDSGRQGARRTLPGRTRAPAMALECEITELEDEQYRVGLGRLLHGLLGRVGGPGLPPARPALPLAVIRVWLVSRHTPSLWSTHFWVTCCRRKNRCRRRLAAAAAARLMRWVITHLHCNRNYRSRLGWKTFRGRKRRSLNSLWSRWNLRSRLSWSVIC